MNSMVWTLVTGGSKRLGAEICRTLAQRGHSLLVHYYTGEKEALEVVRECRSLQVEAECIYGDFSNLDSLQTFIRTCKKRFPEIKNLINNVGPYLLKAGSETTIEEWMAIFQANLHVPFALDHAFISSISLNRGSIIHLGVVGLNGIRSDTKRTAYMSAKIALYQLTKSLAKELASEQVRVNMVSPGYLDNAVDLPEDLHALPMKRPASLHEAARVIAFLLDEESRYITGQNIEIGGGVNL
jgi:NAD(P)-dependent dehydrogenase (short-subunit alcohol dehydrogenase family)